MDHAPTRILIVDDERFFREAIRDALVDAGLRCAVAEDGAEALEQAADPGLGVVILDVQMPGKNGLQVLRELRSERPLLRVIMLSAHSDQEYVLEALRLGACDYLAKPLHEEELVLAVHRALDSHLTARRFDSLHRRLHRLHTELHDLGAGAAGSEGEERARRVHTRAVEAAGRVLDAARISLLMLDDDANLLRVVAAVGSAVPAEEMDPVAVGQGVAGEVFAKGEPLLVSEAEQAPAESPAGRYRSRSFVVVPIADGSHALGVLCATERSDGAPFAEDDLDLLQVLGQQVAILLGQASAPVEEDVPEQVDEGVPEPEATLRSDDAELARAICAATISDVAPERILAAALAATSRALSDAPVAIHVLDAERDGLVREAQHEGALRPDREFLKPRLGLTGSVFSTGCPVAAERPDQDPRFDPDVDTPEDGRSGPLLCVPLSFKGKVLGVFRAFPPGPEPPSPQTAEVLASTLSAALRNVLLYRNLVETIEEVARARREGAGSPRAPNGAQR
jgi:DNA-binding response OmpR family regulator